MATDPARLRVLKALTEALETITPANGYQHDLTGKVYRGRAIFGYRDSLPMVAILENVNELEQPTVAVQNRNQNGPWELLIQGFCEDDKDHPTDPAHHLMAEVKAALIKKRVQSGNRGCIFGMDPVTVTDLKLSHGVVRPPDDEVSDKAYFWLRMTLELVENLTDPYA